MPSKSPLPPVAPPGAPPARRPKPGDGFAWQVLEQVDQALVIIDRWWRLIWANPSAQRFFDVDIEVSHGANVFTLFPETVGSPIQDIYERAMRTGRLQREEIHFAPADLWFHVRATPMGDELLVAYNDITARCQAERRLEASERLHREVTEHVSDVVTRNVLGGPVRWVSPSMTEVLGWTLDDFAGKHLRDIVVSEDQARLEAALRPIQEHGEPLDIELRARHKRGGIRHLQVRGAALPAARPGDPPELVLSSRDITRQVEAREALRQALAAAEAATRAKSAFLANMSHEIRTPLHGVIGMTSLLLDTPLSDQQRTSVDVIRSSGQALLAVINDVLDLSKIEAGAMRIHLEDVDLRRSIEEALDLVTAPAAAKGLELAYRMAPEAPAGVRADPARLRQVLANLLGNAVKFTQAGEVVVDVSASEGTEGGGWLQIAVRDTGEGIPKDSLATLFAPFTQVDESSTRRHGGTGLGLSIARKLVELMGGTISAESVLGEGSVFTVSLPLERAPTTGRVRMSSPPGCLDGLRVLIVDDNAVNRDILLRLCESWHMDPVAYASAVEALRWIDRGAACDLALLDMQMPGIDGQQLARSLRAQRPDLPIVVLSSVGRHVHVPEAFARLAKPIKQTRLYETLVGQFSERRSGVESGRTTPAELRKRGPAPRALLAEDNEVNQLVGRMMLGRLGWEVDVVGDGHEALEALARERYDVVLMDLFMPELDGIETTKRLRARGGKQPWIIALTASALEDDRQRCLAAGMDDHLAKPMTKEALEDALNRAMADGEGEP